MCRRLISLITETLVNTHKIAVIAATHSPSTVAIAPEDALHVMDTDRPGLHKISKAQALNVLTVGVPTLALSYEGRRQVFVESPADAEVYGTIYEVLRPALASERSLEFVATGTRSPTSGADVNTGCDIVTHLVTALAAAGNISTWGLLDWDGRRTRSGRVFVLAQGRRNGLENAVLDPLLLSALLVRERVHLGDIGLDESITYLSFISSDKEILQRVVDGVQRCVLACLPSPAEARSSVQTVYNGGFTLNVDHTYLTIDDHKLEAVVLAAFPSMNAHSKGRAGALLHYVADKIMRDIPAWIPMELREVLHDLLEEPSH
jgi:hypothetical protein